MDEDELLDMFLDALPRSTLERMLKEVEAEKDNPGEIGGKRELEAVKMELGTSQVKQGATVEGSGRLKRDKTLKLRLNAAEVYELDEIGKKLGFAERATTLRWLMEHYPDLEHARQIRQKYEGMQAAKAEFEAVMKV